MAGRLPPSSKPAMEAAIATLRSKRGEWASASILERIDLLRALRRSFAEVAEEWVDACMEAEGLSTAPGERSGEEWVTGPYLVLRNLRLLQIALRNVSVAGAPRIPGPVRTRPDGQVTARVFPYEVWDRVFYPAVTAEVWMEPGVTAEGLPATQALAYRDSGRGGGGVTLVLGAGNVSSIGPMDALHELFVRRDVVLFKTHPVNDYLGPLLERGFRPLVEAGYLRIVYGGAGEGDFLCRHPGVDAIHVTGSDKTFEAIVFGPGEEGRRRKAAGEPHLDKRVSAELGNVSPVVVVPGRWSADEIAYHAENVATMLTNNAGFNCNALRVLVTHAEWEQRGELLTAIRAALAAAPTRKAYYPGAAERAERFLDAHPETERFGDPDEGELPWMLVPDVDPASDDVCFTTESFCGLFAVVGLSAPSAAELVDRAVAFCNGRLWGTLNATLLAHPATLKDPEVGPRVEAAIAGLRYGTVSINHWAAVGYGLVVTPWGAFPGHPPTDIQSGTGAVHNTLMFSRPQKVVVRAPFTVWPKPLWFQSHRVSYRLGRGLTRFEASPSVTRLPGILITGLGA